VDTFLENAQRIFDVARADSGAETSDFALLVRPDGSLHVVMGTELNLDAVAIDAGASAAYRVTRSRGGVKVSGRERGSRCELSSAASALPPFVLRDQPLYLMATPPALAAVSC
jgi:predicted hotdog family 3-hydroxylacyl-ACP dehydratase